LIQFRGHKDKDLYQQAYQENQITSYTNNLNLFHAWKGLLFDPTLAKLVEDEASHLARASLHELSSNIIEFTLAYINSEVLGSGNSNLNLFDALDLLDENSK
jgi:hypothetical protein